MAEGRYVVHLYSSQDVPCAAIQAVLEVIDTRDKAAEWWEDIGNDDVLEISRTRDGQHIYAKGVGWVVGVLTEHEREVIEAFEGQTLDD